MGGNKIGSFINNMTFEAELNVNGRTVNEPFVKKNPCKEGEVFESGKKCYHQRNIRHKRNDLEKLIKKRAMFFLGFVVKF